MSWIGGIFAAIAVFFGSIFGSHAPVQTSQTSQTPVEQNTQAATGNGNTGSQPDAHFVVLMQQIGCTDQSSCIEACTHGGPAQACQQLQSIMAGQESQGRSSSAYTMGSPSGGEASGVANVGNNIDANAGALPACPANNDLFTQSPVAVADLAGIEPLGHMNAEHILPNQADHVYLQAKSTGSVAVYAPGNATLLGVAKTTGIAGEDTGADSVKLFFSSCKSTMFALQINTLSPQIIQALAALQPSSVQKGATTENVAYGPLNIALTAGEELGTIVGMNGRGGEADFAAADVRTAPLQFIDQSEQTGMLADSYAHAVCPLDYFSGSVRSALYSLLTVENAGANGIPACGAVLQDKAGTAQGNWYDKSGETPSYQGIDEASLLAIAHYNLDPAKGIISVGTDLIPSQALGTQLIFTPQQSGTTNREPSEITPDGNVYCFDGPMGAGGVGDEGHIDIKLASATLLMADYGSGACAASPALSSAAVTYDR